MTDPEITKAIALALSRIQERTAAEHPHILRTDELSRADRELLIRTGWLCEIMHGWYLLVKPNIHPNDSTPWFAHFWDFLALYLKHRFDTLYCLSAESSLEVLMDVSVLPKQVIAIVPQGGGKAKSLPYDTSLLMYTDPKNIPTDRVEKRGLQIMPLPLALCRVSPVYFRTNPEEAEIALRSIRSASILSEVILKYNFKSAAARLLGAYHFLGDNVLANNLEKDLKAFGVKVIPENPFQQLKPFLKSLRPPSPYIARIEALWQKNREIIIQEFPKAPGIPNDIEKYLKNVDEIYESDAYNSLSIEGYKITPELIERVKNNNWDPKNSQSDLDERNALAARGYYEAFQAVKTTLEKLLTQSKNPGDIIEEDLQDWYRRLFSPAVNAGIIKPTELLGYRNHPVYIRNSRYVPPPVDAVLDIMEYLFKALKEEPEASVRAILGHYVFVFVHPYMDGNGRIARFLMNAMLASGGYSWIVIPLVKRAEYMNALSIADLEHNLSVFAKFVSELFKEYTFHDIVILNAAKEIIKTAGYSPNHFEIKVWNLDNEGKSITVCSKKNRRCKKDFSVSYPPYNKPIFLAELTSLFSDSRAIQSLFDEIKR